MIAIIFLSQLLHKAIYDSANQRIGTLRDICVVMNQSFPAVNALLVQPTHGSERLLIPWAQVQSIELQPIQLNVTQQHIGTHEPSPEDVFLRRDILNRQIVDTQSFRVVKVHDLKLAQIKRTARLLGADIGGNALLRRLGWQQFINLPERISPLNAKEQIVTWNYVEQIQFVKEKERQDKLSELHPADIADILEQLDLPEAEAMLNRLNDETAAEALNEVELPLQSEILNNLAPQRASVLLELLPPDDAADILAEMQEEKAEELLNLMPTSESQPIRDLLRYESETAGGIMTSKFLTQPYSETVEQALHFLREHSSHLDMIYYLYIVDEEQHLQGVVSLRQLVTSEPYTTMAELMDTDIIKVNVHTDQEEVARIIAKYDLLSVPVVDDEDHLKGIVTVDDVIDVIHAEQAEDISDITGTEVGEVAEEEGSWLRNMGNRAIWSSINVLAGFIMAGILVNILPSLLNANLALTATFFLIPMLLLTSGNAGAQSLAVVGWELGNMRGKDFFRASWRELLYGSVNSILMSLLAGIFSWFLFHSLSLSLIITLAFSITLIVATLCGAILPNLLQRLHLKGSFLTAPLLNPVIAIINLSTFLAITLSLLNEISR